MKMLHLKQADFATNRWSGGTTTQLFIWPEGASYASREFQVRISSAVVELPESDFTPLPGVTRYITPLSSSFTLTHPGKAPVVMNPLDAPYRFSGEESTHCVGKATDFNLMLKGVEGEMCLAHTDAQLRPGLNAFYAPAPRRFTVDGAEFPLQAGEMLVVITDTPDKILLGPEKCLACYAAVNM